MKTKNQFLLKHFVLFLFIINSLTLFASNEKENILSKKTVNENAVQSQKTSPPKIDLHTAVLKNDIKAVKQHIAAKSDLNIKEAMGGSTPLISASLFGKTEIAKLLINAGANLNIQNNDGSTALITAAFFCRPEIVKMLLAKKANKTIKNNYGQTAYETLLTPFNQVKPVYETLGNALSPLGLKLDYAYIEKTRPIIAKMLK